MSDPYAGIGSADPYDGIGVAEGGEAAPAPKKRSLSQDVTGFMSKLNRGLGVGDELAAGFGTAADLVTGKAGLGDIPDAYKANLAHQRDIEDSYQTAHPHLAALATGTGNAFTAAAPVGPGAEAFANSGRVVNALRGAAVAGLTGAGYAAVDRGSIAERAGAAAAAARDPVTLALGAGAGALATTRGVRADRPAVPTLEELTGQKNAAYGAVDASGVTYTPQAFRQLTRDMATTLDEAGFHAGLHPKSATMLERLGESERASGGYAPSLTQLDQLRQQIGRDIASSPDAGERRMGQMMRDQIDQFIATAGPDAMQGGNAQAASELISQARDLNTRVSKLRDLGQLDDKAARRASRTGSGGNKENALRQNVDRFLDDTGNLTPEEEAAARRTVDGTRIGNALRQVGKLSPEGNGLGFTVHAVGGAASHGATLPLAAVGFVAKRVSEALTRGNVRALRELIATGGAAAREVSRQLADPQYADLRAQLANDLSAQAGVQGASRRASVTAEIPGHPEYGVGASSR